MLHNQQLKLETLIKVQRLKEIILKTELQMKYQVFMTTCVKSQVNDLNRILLDIHSSNPDYLGDGVFVSQASSFMYPKTPFQEAVKHYGVNAFIKTVLLETTDYDKAWEFYKTILTKEVIKQAHIFNWQLPNKFPHIYQFNKEGKFIKRWNREIIDFYGLPYNRYLQAAECGGYLLNSYWSLSSNLIKMYKPMHIIFKYNLDGKLVDEFYSINNCAEQLHLDENFIREAIKNQTLIDNKFYLSNKLYELFNPKPRRQYAKVFVYVYKKGKFIDKVKGKELMRLIKEHSWNKIAKAFNENKGYYEDYQMTLQPRVLINLYTLDNSYIETFYDEDSFISKYKVTKKEMNQIQHGNKYFRDYIVKYSSCK